jgi:hypothetical protein
MFGFKAADLVSCNSVFCKDSKSDWSLCPVDSKLCSLRLLGASPWGELAGRL